MVILNTTFVLHIASTEAVVDWIRRTYMESAKKCGACGQMLTHILSPIEDGSECYALHLTFPELAAAEKWNEGVGKSLRKIMNDRWGEKALTFCTYMEVIE